MSRPLSEAGRALVAGLLQDPDALQAHILAEQARRSGSRSFASFVKQAWHIIDGTPLVWGWHVQTICDHLEAVSRGEITRLLVNVPPGHAKSLLVSVLWPAWMWAKRPGWQVICASHGHDLAVRDAIKSRQIIESPWYRQNFGGNWTLREDQNTKSLYVNTAFGHRLSVGIGGGVIGHRAHCIIIDDPLNAKEAHSKAARDEATRFMQTASTRFNDASSGVMVMIMQRLHEEDPSGFVLAGGGWEHVMLPAEYESYRKSRTFVQRGGERVLFWEDPRETEGELLFPAKFSREVLTRLRRPNELGEYGYAGQEQQNPSPVGGGIFKVADWRFWQPDTAAQQRFGYGSSSIRPRGCVGAEEFPAQSIDLEDLDDMLLSVDATFRETKSGSFVAIHVWGRKGSRRVLIYRVHRRMDFTDTVIEMLRVIEMFPEARRKLIEGKANGDAILSTLEKSHGVIGLEAVPVSGSKEQRANAMQPYVTAHNVELPEGAPWLDEYIAEHAAFPNGANDDDVDAQSQGLQGLEKARTAMELWGELEDDDPFI